VARITFVPYTDSFAKANELSTGCPIQAFFWLEWGRFPIRARTSIKLYLPSISLLNLQRALGIETIPAVQANPLCHFQLLPPLAIALLSSREANIRERTGTRPSSVRSSDLRLRDYAGTRSSAGLRARAGRPRRGNQVAQRRSVATVDRVAMDSDETGACRGSSHRTETSPLKPTEGLNGAPVESSFALTTKWV